jgi:hypothetical protein
MSLCRTLSPPGCPRDEFVFATTASSQCPAKPLRRVHALGSRLPAPRVCAPRSLRRLRRRRVCRVHALSCWLPSAKVRRVHASCSVARARVGTRPPPASRRCLHDRPPKLGPPRLEHERSGPAFGRILRSSEASDCSAAPSRGASGCPVAPTSGRSGFSGARVVRVRSAVSCRANGPLRSFSRLPEILEARSPCSCLLDERVAVRSMSRSQSCLCDRSIANGGASSGCAARCARRALWSRHRRLPVDASSSKRPSSEVSPAARGTFARLPEHSPRVPGCPSIRLASQGCPSEAVTAAPVARSIGPTVHIAVARDLRGHRSARLPESFSHRRLRLPASIDPPTIPVARARRSTGKRCFQRKPVPRRAQGRFARISPKPSSSSCPPDSCPSRSHDRRQHRRRTRAVTHPSSTAPTASSCLPAIDSANLEQLPTRARPRADREQLPARNRLGQPSSSHPPELDLRCSQRPRRRPTRAHSCLRALIARTARPSHRAQPTHANSFPLALVATCTRGCPHAPACHTRGPTCSGRPRAQFPAHAGPPVRAVSCAAGLRFATLLTPRLPAW